MTGLEPRRSSARFRGCCRVSEPLCTCATSAVSHAPRSPNCSSSRRPASRHCSPARAPASGRSSRLARTPSPARRRNRDGRASLPPHPPSALRPMLTCCPCDSVKPREARRDLVALRSRRARRRATHSELSDPHRGRGVNDGDRSKPRDPDGGRAPRPPGFLSQGISLGAGAARFCRRHR
jgi:hypothetical protein